MPVPLREALAHVRQLVIFVSHHAPPPTSGSAFNSVKIGRGTDNTVVDHGTPTPPLGSLREMGRGDRSTAQGAEGAYHTPNASPDRQRLVMSEMTQDAL